MKIRAIIVDDEPLARAKLRTFLDAQDDVEVLAECADGREALEAIARLSPDLVFLDVQMPEVDGFAVAEALPPDKSPHVIFVTAHDQYALKAFEVYALDYLLKPFDRQRFQKALDRARAELKKSGASELKEHLAQLLGDLKGRPKYLGRIVTKSGGRIFFLRTEEIDYIEAEGNYVRLHTGAESHLLRETMNGLEQKLDPEVFVRIHRSTMVNIERIKELQPWFRGDYVVILQGGKQLTLSRGYRERLEAVLGKSF